MLRSLLAALLGAVASSKLLAGSHEEDFARFLRFVKDYDRTYKNTDEFSKKFEAFRGFLKLADERNKANRDAGGKDVHGITKFADLTQEEFRARYLMKPGYYKQRVHSSGYTSTLKSSSSLGNVDWRKQGAMTAVNNQGECGGCWAISATQALESFGQIQHQYGLTALSFQETCSCTYDYNGCNGGNPQDAYKSIVRLGGLISSEGYPWVFNCTSCEEERASASGRKYLTADGYTNAPRGSLQSVLKNNGPPAVAVTAEFWNTYQGGVLTACQGVFLDHAVQAVGYMTEGVETSYWIVRNSWGADWGEEGYIYLSMDSNKGDICKLQHDISYPNTKILDGSNIKKDGATQLEAY